MTEFNDASHWGLFTTGANLSSAERVRHSELTLAALRAAGILGNMIDGTTAPATDKLWLDKNSDPGVLKEYDTLNSAWVPVTFDRLFGRAVVTNLTATAGDDSSVTVSAPTTFLDNRLYSVVPPVTSTGAYTLTITGVGTFDVVYAGGEVLTAGELQAGQRVVMLFRDGRFEVLFNFAGVYAARDAAIAAAAEAAGYADDAEAALAAFEPGAMARRDSVALAKLSAFPASIKVVETAYYAPTYANLATLCGGARYKRTTAQPTDHSLWFRSLDRYLPDGTTDETNGGHWEIDEEFVTPEMIGAVQDGLVDCSTAVTDWLEYILIKDATGALEQYTGSGGYLLNSFVHLTTINWNGGIKGPGSGCCRFIVPISNTEGGIWIEDLNRSGQTRCEGFTILRRGTGGIGFRISQPEGGANLKRSTILRDIYAVGENGTSDYWEEGIGVIGGWHPDIQNCVVRNIYIFAEGVDPTSGTSPRFFGDVGFNLDGCYDIMFRDNMAWGCATLVRSHCFTGTVTAIEDGGVDAGGLPRVKVTISNGPHPFSSGFVVRLDNTTNYNALFTVTNIPGSGGTQFYLNNTVFAGAETSGRAYLGQQAEAGRFENNILNGCIDGIDWQRLAGPEPILWVKGNHINFVRNGLRCDGARLVIAEGNVPYAEGSVETFAGTPIDFNFINAQDVIVTDNVCHFNSHPNRINVWMGNNGVGNSGDNSVIADNIFNNNGAYAVHLTAGVEKARVGPNNYNGTYSLGRPVNDVNMFNYLVQTETVFRGAWTPVLTFGGASTGITYSTQSADYQCAGGMIHFFINIVLTSKGTATGNAEISLLGGTGLAGPKEIVTNKGFGQIQFYSGMASLVAPIARPVSPLLLRLQNQNATAVSNLTDANFSNTSNLQISGTLFLA